MRKPATAENAAGGRLDPIGVPFDGMGRAPGQAAAPQALRAAGLPAALGPDAVMEPDLVLPGPVPERAAGSGLLNERALLEMIGALCRRVRASLSAGRFPFIYGADCAVLLAAVPALRDVAGRAGLVFVDGHEDATPMDLSPSGEAANMEIALLLGLTGERAPQPLRRQLPALAPGAIAMLGPRDHLFRQAASVPTVAGQVWLRPADEVSADPAGYVRMAIEHVVAQAPRWWLHIDLDVLARSEFAACGAPGEIMLAGGLTWRQLTQIATAAMQDAGCCGWSLAIYNPELDPDRGAARRIVEFVAQVASSMSR
ncbi:MAG TPA: arginase family protein [Streptosporangiaceae bacterium]|nr:arginase family protein [Streptosporangiaceae bacterium]